MTRVSLFEEVDESFGVDKSVAKSKADRKRKVEERSAEFECRVHLSPERLQPLFSVTMVK